MRILGINAIGHHDASAGLVEDGQLVAFAEEERFTRLKHAVGQRPLHAVEWCLKSRGLSWNNIDAIATPWVEEEFGILAPAGYREDLSFGYRELGTNTERWPANLREFLAEAGCPPAQTPSLFQVSHHLAHAASAYWCSGMDDTAILVVDGEGDRVSSTLAHGHKGQITLLRQFSTVDSLGQFYACVTDFLGLGPFGEGKMMGLAPYGRARIDIPEISIDGDGYRIKLGGGLKDWDPQGTDYQAIIDAWMRTLSGRFGSKRPSRDRGTPSRLDDWPALDLDLAASAQHTLEIVLIHLARTALNLSGTSNLAIAGGVALNCSANGQLASMPEIERLFVQPAAGDNGVPIGAALHVSALSGEHPMTTMRSAALGPSFNAQSCADALSAAGLPYTEPDDITDAAAEHLASNDVVCWFDGAAEAGPRALGQRSILASPGSAKLRDRVNNVKRRAHWRPLAPSIRSQDSTSLLERGSESPFMIVSDRVAPQWHDLMPGVVHIDGSARPQTVDPDVSPAYWSLIDRFHSRTGLHAVINTSFNDEREPIVCTPSEAIRTYLRSSADALCLGPYLITRADRSAASS